MLFALYPMELMARIQPNYLKIASFIYNMNPEGPSYLVVKYLHSLIGVCRIWFSRK